MIRVCVISILLVESISDIRTRKVSLIRLFLYLGLSLAINAVFNYESWVSADLGMGVGVLLLIYAFATREKIGYGDSIMFIITGAFLGLSENIRLVFFSMIVAIIIGIAYILVAKKSIKSRIPFMPCILITYLIMILVGAYES